MDLDMHPNPQPNPHHRKIDLQSVQDLTYLQNNLAQSALQKLDLHFPKISKPATHISLDGTAKNSQQNSKQELSSQHNNITNGNPQEEHDDNEEEEDPMRHRVHTLITQFLHATWQTAVPSIAVNGHDATSLPIPYTATLSPVPHLPMPNDSTAVPQQLPAEIENVHFAYAPFDAGLQRKLAALHGELEALTSQVARLRRTAPGKGAEVYQERLERAMLTDEQAFSEETERFKGEEEQGLDIEGVRQGWNEDVRDVFERGLTDLGSLAGVGEGKGPTLTETVGKAQRAGRVAMELE